MDIQYLIEEFAGKGLDIPLELRTDELTTLINPKNGWNLAAHYIPGRMLTKGDIPEYLITKDLNKYKNDKTYIQYLWILMRKTDLPIYLQESREDRDKNREKSFQIAAQWINIIHKPLPDYLLFGSGEDDENNYNTMIDKDGYTLLHHWLSYYNNLFTISDEIQEPIEIPQQLLYDFEKYQYKTQMTPQEFWIRFIKRPLPLSLRYNNMKKYISRKYNEPFAVMWISHLKTPPPNYLICNSILKVVCSNGYTMKEFWEWKIPNIPYPYVDNKI